MTRCDVCRATERLTETAPHNWLCEEHLAARDHVVRMTRDAGDSVATCQCDWTSRVPVGLRVDQGEQIRRHWLDVSGVPA